MKFLDTNVFVYALFVTKRQLTANEQTLKEKSRAIIAKIDAGEKIAISVVHLSEIANILRNCYAPTDLSDLLESLYTKENVLVFDVTNHDYLVAIHLSKLFGVPINDCLAAFLMKQNRIDKIYSFDADFKKFNWVEAITE